MICAAVTDDDDDANELADGTIGAAALFIAGVLDGVELADRADDGGDGVVTG